MSEHLNLGNPLGANLMNTPTSLLKHAWQIYKTNYKKLIELNLVPVLGFIPIVVIMMLYRILGTSSAITNVLLGILLVASVLFCIYLGVSAQAGFIKMVQNLNLGVMEAVNEGRKIFWSYFGLSLLVVVLVLLWTLLLIVPGIVFGIYYSMAMYVLVFENISGKAAINQSKQLVKGHWWAVVGRVLFMALVVTVPLILLSSISAAMPRESLAYQLWSTVVNIVSFIIAPLSSVYSILIYKDLVRIKNNPS